MFLTRRFNPYYFSTGEEGGALPVEGEPTPPEGTGTTETNWEERYKEAQAWGTRNAQRAAELERYERMASGLSSEDAQERQWAAEQLGLSLETAEDPDTLTQQYAELDPAVKAQLDAFTKAQEQQAQTQQQQAQQQAYRSDVDPQIKALGVPDALVDMVAQMAWDLPAVNDQYGQAKPDLQKAIANIEEIVLAAADIPSLQSKVLNKYKSTKRAVHVASTGTAGTKQPNLDNRAERLAWMQEQLEARDT